MGKKARENEKKRKRNPRKILRDKVWALFSEYVRRRDDGICATCGKVDHWKNMQAGHFIHKDCLDFDERNINCQCPQCNKWKHGNLAKYSIFLKSKYGPEVLDDLDFLGGQVKVWEIKELEGLLGHYTKKLKEMVE